MTTLRESLIGRWQLVSFEAQQSSGETIFPMGRNPKGYLTYTPDGFMSVQMMVPGRAPLASGDISEGDSAKWEAAARGYSAYCGTYEVDEASRTVTHHVEISLVPDWVGQDQIRSIRLIGPELELSPPPTLNLRRDAHGALGLETFELRLEASEPTLI